MYPIKTPKKLIEVALPLDAINEESALRKRKAPGGYPTTLHKWWAQRPVAAARAIIFAQMVNDPGGQRGYFSGMTKDQAKAKREELFKIIEELIKWENTNNHEVLERARAEILKSWRETCELNKSHPEAAVLFNPEKLPGFHDPFSGSAALPLEAQRLGLETYASDLNPVAVIISKAMIEIPSKFSSFPPVGPEVTSENGRIKQATKDAFEDWSGARGLAEDVRRYGRWMFDQAEQRIGHLYPTVEIDSDVVAERPDLRPYLGEKLKVIAWLWARTVRSPNPAFSHAEVPLASTFVLSSKAGKEVYVDPVVDGDSYRFVVRVGAPPESAKGGTTAGKRSAFICLLSNSPVDYNYIRAEGQAGRIGQRLMAIVAEGKRGRVYLSPMRSQAELAQTARPEWVPEMVLPSNPRDFKTPNYGLGKFGDLFTSRQLVSLNTFSGLVQEAIEHVHADAIAAGMSDDCLGLDQGGGGATAYAQAVGVYLACAVSRMADYGCSLATWRPKDNAMRSGMPKQALQMSWDFAEGSPLAASSAGFYECAQVVAKVIETSLNCGGMGKAFQESAASTEFKKIPGMVVISTDPPYYDNIGYADLSDFLYIWLRRSIKHVFPSLFSTLAVPKAEELVATPYRHGGKENAESFFLQGMKSAIGSLASRAHPGFPVTIYYAFKQAETKDDIGTSSTGWETFLSAVIGAGLSITGTWPVRTEGDNRQVGAGANALASSIVLVCRKRDAEAKSVSRREFIRELNMALPDALAEMTRGGVNSPVAPVDLSQAIIGPGMEVFSKYGAVLEADGSAMSVKTALQLINRFIAEDDFDHDTQFCLSWFEQYGWASGKYGDADVLARAKGTSVGGLIDAGVVESSAGNLRLLKWVEMPRDWSPETDSRVPIWEALHQLIRALNQDGETAAGALLARMPDKTAGLTALTYRLYTLCERQGWAEEARAYNELQGAWGSIEQASQDAGPVHSQFGLDIQ